MRVYRFIVMLFLFSAPVVVNAQEEEVEAEMEMEYEEEEFKRNKLALYTGYTWMPLGRNPETQKKEVYLAPTFGFSYEFWFAERWAIGTYNDIEIVKFEVEKNDGSYLKRENAFSFSLALVYEILPGWTAIAGAGLETDKHETLFIGHFATEYVILEKNYWELAVSLSYIRKDFYDGVGIGFVFGRKF